MAAIVTTLPADQIDDLVDHLLSLDTPTGDASSVTFSLTYSEDAQADQLIVTGAGLAFSGSSLTAGTITSIEFRLGATSILAASDINLTAEQFNALSADSQAFGNYLEFLAGDDHGDLSGTPILGDDGDDDLISGTDDDYLAAGGGDDHVEGGGGDDVLYGDDGDDDLYGGAGDDHIDGGAGTDDTVHYEDAKKVSIDLSTGKASSSEGKDTVVNVENVLGSSGNDSITGNDTDNDLYGDDGNDHLDGGSGDDLLAGGSGNDKLSGGDGADDLEGDDGNDNLSGGAGADLINAGSGNDKIDSGDDDDAIFGDAGNDAIFAGAGDDEIDGGAGKDNIKAGDGDDVIDGGSGADVMAGGGGNDTYFVDDAKDKIVEQAGQGDDTVVSAFSISLDKLKGIENIILSEDAQPRDIDATGNAGSNEITGNSGDNVINGKAGADILAGGAGNDTFVFDNLALGGADTITDFSAADDLLVFQDSVFKSLVGDADLSDNLAIGTAAATSTDFLIFDDATGDLYYDADGSGASTAVLIATLTGVDSLDSTNIALI